MIVLGIETSCDETSIALVKEGKEILSNIISSQVDIHKIYGGVVPEIASRLHAERINSLLKLALDSAHIRFKDIDLISVTYGPGLVGALWVGITMAKTISLALNKPLIGVNHLVGHIFANFLREDPPEFPFISYIISGGHTELILVEDYDKYKLLGQTLDDAAGEAFDKVARLLGLEYPGGPAIEKVAKDGKLTFDFPKVKCDRDLDISFSGLKTSVLYLIRNLQKEGKAIPIADIAFSFQHRIVEELLERALLALNKFNISTLVLAGGVVANKYLQERFYKASKEEGFKIYMPPPILCTDNAAMIASAGYYLFKKGKIDNLYISANPSLTLGV
ncbi:MAG: tRNA (adenosine(37)-N6)-threonylcarbamoyltransferase complex transferase subunit TsaD [Dictyoglomus sp. NZ13-RE01]|nr:MAG: tRNA (adenosine(37)-N6)-threonylcarbamoyltransferase complex transferase subunit TsaD [Dictyoglomus sp. NZ13-RE01]